jgi:hypothetical protein
MILKCAETHVNYLKFPQAHWTHYVAPEEKGVRGFVVSEQQLGTSYLQENRNSYVNTERHINYKVHINI